MKKQNEQLTQKPESERFRPAFANTVLAVVLLFSALSCYDTKRRCYVCNTEEKQKISEFISNNIKPANNMSDEEMEDVIRQLEETAIKINCRQKLIPATWDGDVIWKDVQKKEDETIFPFIY